MRKLFFSSALLLRRRSAGILGSPFRSALPQPDPLLPHRLLSSSSSSRCLSRSSAALRPPTTSYFGLLHKHATPPPAAMVGAINTRSCSALLESFVRPMIRSFSFSLQRRSSLLRFSPLPRSWMYFMGTPDGMVRVLIGFNVAIFFLWKVADPSFMRKHFMISLDNLRSGRLHTLLTSAFSHSDLDHLVTNMIGLYFFGTSVANMFGPQFLLKLYLAGALVGSLFFLAHKAFLVPSRKDFQVWVSSRVSALGASAAVNAIILLEVFLFPKRLVYLYFVLPVPAALVGALLIGADLWRVRQGHGNVDGSAHLGGALVAAVVWAGIRKGWI